MSPGRSAVAKRPARAISILSPDGVAEAVIDQFEAIDVEEQHRAAGARVPDGALQVLLDAIHEQAAIGEPGEGIVQRVVLEAQLSQPAVSDVGDRARHPGRRAVGPAHRQATGDHPPPAPVGVAHPVLQMQVRGAAVQVRLDRGADAGDVPRVHEREPERRVALAGIRIAPGSPEDGVPAG